MLNYMSWTVYRHITPSGKSYIGITSQKPENRWRNGKGYNQKGQQCFHNAIEKYKWENIKHIIVSTDLTEKEAKWLENYLICYYWTFVGFKDSKGYNCTLGGDDNIGIKFSNEHNNKISKSRKGIKFSDEHKRKIGESNKGKTPWNKGIPSQLKGIPRDAETKHKISESNKGKTAWNIGISPSEETRRKRSEAMKGKHRVYHEDGTFHMER